MTLQGRQSGPTFSPDGSHIAFAWDGDAPSGAGGYDLYVKAIGSETLLRLRQHPSRCLDAAWSPDGTQIAFHRLSGSDDGLYVVPALGGAERKLRSTHLPFSMACYTGISWSPDGRWIAFVDSQPTGDDRIHLLSVETLESTQIPHAACQAEWWPAYSPDGSQLAYTCFHGGMQFGIYSVSPSGGQPKLITKFLGSPFGIAWTADNKRLIFLRYGTNASEGELDEVTVADGSIRKLPFGGRWPTISRTGDKLAYITTSNNINIWRKDLLHPEAPAVKLLSSTREETYPQYSPDGNHIAFMSSRTGNNWEIWMSDGDGTHLVQVSNFKYPFTGSPRWSPNGKTIAFDSRESGHGEVYIVDISERIPRRLVTNLAENSVPSWSRDGKWIYFIGHEEGVAGQRIFRCPATGGDGVALTARAANFSYGPMEYHDGKTVYFTTSGPAAMATLRTVSVNDTRTESVLREMPPVKQTTLWALVPGGIYFVPADAPRSVRYFDFATKNVRQVFDVNKDFSWGLSVSPDGRWILYSQFDDLKSEILLVDHFH